MGPKKAKRTVGGSFPTIPPALLDQQLSIKWAHCLKQFGSNTKPLSPVQPHRLPGFQTEGVRHALCRDVSKLEDADSDFSNFFPESWAQYQPPTSCVFLDSICWSPFPLLPPWFWAPLFHANYCNSFLSGLSPLLLLPLWFILQPQPECLLLKCKYKYATPLVKLTSSLLLQT